MGLIRLDSEYIRLNISDLGVSWLVEYYIYRSKEDRDLEKTRKAFVDTLLTISQQDHDTAYAAMMARADACGFTDDDARDEETISRCLERDSLFRDLYLRYSAINSQLHSLQAFLSEVSDDLDIPDLAALCPDFSSVPTMVRESRPKPSRGRFSILKEEPDSLALVYERVKDLKVFQETVDA